MSSKTQKPRLTINGCYIERRWWLSGVGPARYGYGYRAHSGAHVWIGRTRREAEAIAD